MKNLHLYAIILITMVFNYHGVIAQGAEQDTNESQFCTNFNKISNDFAFNYNNTGGPEDFDLETLDKHRDVIFPLPGFEKQYFYTARMNTNEKNPGYYGLYASGISLEKALEKYNTLVSQIESCSNSSLPFITTEKFTSGAPTKTYTVNDQADKLHAVFDNYIMVLQVEYNYSSPNDARKYDVILNIRWKD